MTERDSVFKIVIIGTPVTRISMLLEQHQPELHKDLLQHTSDEFSTISVKIEYLGETHTLQYSYWKFLPDDWKKDRESKQEFYRDVEGAILVCDYGFSDSLLDVKAWKADLKRYTSKPVPIILLCIKSEDEKVRLRTAQDLATDHKLKHYETSISNPNLLSKLSKILIKEIVQSISGTPYFLKIVIIGDQTKFKTSFVRNYADHFSDGESYKTLGHFPGSKLFRVNKQLIKLILMDLDGRDFFGQLRSNYYRGASGCVIVFDKSDRLSFEHVSNWFDDFRKHVPSPDIPIVILGIKSKDVDVSSDEGKALANQLNLHYLESSFPSFDNSDELFEYLVKKLLF